MYKRLLSCDAVRSVSIGACEFRREDGGNWSVSIWDADEFATLDFDGDTVTGVVNNSETLYSLPVQVARLSVSVKADTSVEPRALLDYFTVTFTSPVGDVNVRGMCSEGIAVSFFAGSSPFSALDKDYEGELMTVLISSHELVVTTYTLLNPAWYRSALDSVFGVAQLFVTQEDTYERS